MTNYVYVRSEPQLWTVGFYDPQGRWNAESDHESKDEAATRAAQMNGAQVLTPAYEQAIERLQTNVNSLLSSIARYHNGNKPGGDPEIDSMASAVSDALAVVRATKPRVPA